jgi:hypothetical protein
MSTEEEPIKGVVFSDPTAALRLRNAVQRMAAKEIEKAGSNGQVARVMAVDIAKLTASVWFPGDDGPVTVNMFKGAIPLDLGDYRGTTIVETSAIGTGGLVWIENFRGQPYITRIISGGEFTLDQRVAGLTHQSFRATRQGTNSGSPIAGIYERHVTIELSGGSDFTVGKAMLVGPWSGRNDGSSVDGIFEMTLSYWVSGDVKNQVRKYQFSVSDRMIVDLEGDEGNKPFWMRILPVTNLGTTPHAELAVDVALVKTGIRTNLEFWFRLVPLDTWADQSVYFMSVKTYGSAFNVGDPKTGRVVAILDPSADPLQGFLGFHNAGMSWTERDEIGTFPTGSWFQGDEWSSGSWRSGAVRAANDLRWTWHNTSQWSWFSDDEKLFWEGNIIFSGIGPNWNGLHTGSISVPYPNQGIPVFPSNPSDFPTQWRGSGGSGIVLKAGETLYYGLCPGMGTGGQGQWINAQNYFFIVDSKTYNATQYNFSLPEWAIPIATRPHVAYGEQREIHIHNPSINEDIDDRSTYTYSVYSTAHGNIPGLDETELMVSTAFKWRFKTAYEVSFKCGLYATTTASTLINLRIRKGTTDAGTDLGEYFRVPIQNSQGVHQAEGTLIIYNDTNADITSNIVLTGHGETTSPQWGRHASATSPSWLRIRKMGTSGNWAALGRQI